MRPGRDPVFRVISRFACHSLALAVALALAIAIGIGIGIAIGIGIDTDCVVFSKLNLEPENGILATRL